MFIHCFIFVYSFLIYIYMYIFFFDFMFLLFYVDLICIFHRDITPVARLFLTRLDFEKNFKTQGTFKTQK